jgi:hypothetical protein
MRILALARFALGALLLGAAIAVYTRQPTPSKGSVLITYEEGPFVDRERPNVPPGTTLAWKPPSAYYETTILVTYDRVIRETDYEAVRAEVSQEKRVPRANGLVADTDWIALTALESQVRLLLNSSFFALAEKDKERQLPRGTSPLPARLAWTLKPSQAGEAAFTLRLQDVKNADVKLNGVAQKPNGDNDDYVISVTVETSLGLSSWVYAGILAALSVLVVVIGWVVELLKAWIGRSRST